MKVSIITSGLVLASISFAHAQTLDLPDPGVSAPPAVVKKSPAPSFSNAGQYAGSLRLSGISRRQEGTAFRIVLEEKTRLVRLDVRVSSGKTKIRAADLVTVSGNRIEIRNFRDTNVLDISEMTRSENFSLNEDIAEIQILTEGFAESSEMILTAVSEQQIPKLSFWHPPLSDKPSYVIGQGPQIKEEPVVIVPVQPVKRGATCSAGFCVRDVVLYNRYRALIIEILPDGKLVLKQLRVRKVVSPSEVRKVLEPPFRG